MTSVDKAAIAWSIAIVAVGVAIAFAGPGISLDSGSPAPSSPPSMMMQEEKKATDPFADIAQETMSKQEEREKAMAEQMGMKEGSSGVTVSAPKVTEPPKMTAPMTAKVSMPAGTSVPGCEETNACYVPATVSIQTGGTVTWSNDDTAAHTVTSGSPQNGPDGKFDSSLVLGGKTYEFTFQSAGSYDYFCMVHPWMTGKVQVG